MSQLWSGFCLTLTLSQFFPIDRVMDFLSPFDEDDADLGVDININDDEPPVLMIYHHERDKLEHLSEAVLGNIEAEGGAGQAVIAELAARDWVGEVQRNLPSVHIGRFFIHGSHDRVARPPARLSIEIEAGQAFGTGYHETTAACLQALMAESKQKPPRAILDFGCGSGVLGLAALKLFHNPVRFIDIDPVAISVCRDNAKANGLPWRGKLQVSARPNINVGGLYQYDLIFANILAEPLMKMALSLSKALLPGGRLILAGILAKRGQAVVSAYRRQGLVLVKTRRDVDWISYVMKKPS